MAAFQTNFNWVLAVATLFSTCVLSGEVKLSKHYTVEWYRVGDDSIAFELEVEFDVPGYVGFGISDHHRMRGADIVTIVVSSENSSAVITDMHGIGNTKPVTDKHQDYKLETMSRNDTKFRFKVTRLIDTCDPDDVEILEDTTQYLLWCFGKIHEDTNEIRFHKHKRGGKAVNLLDPTYKAPDLSAYKVWNLHQSVVLNTDETMYWCQLHKVPELGKKHHIVGFSLNLTDPLAEKHTHHGSVLSCSPPPGENAEDYFAKFLDPKGFDCYYSEPSGPLEFCKMYDFQWANVGAPVLFPEIVGIPFGDSRISYYMTMLHIRNPIRQSWVKFKSGFDLYYTNNLRNVDAGFMQIGTSPSKGIALTVPPNTNEFIHNSHCSAECTGTLPTTGIIVFGYLLHFHLAGRKIRVRHFRNGTELPWLANDENYDANYQFSRILRKGINVLPNDHLTIECTFDSTNRSGSVIIGGRSIKSEMCQAFLMYYPEMKGFDQCGSSVPQRQMLDFMGIQDVITPYGDNNPIVLKPDAWNGWRYSKMVQRMNWTIEKRWAFQQMTRYNYHEAECSGSGSAATISTKYPILKTGTEYAPVKVCKARPSHVHGSKKSGAASTQCYLNIIFFIVTTMFALLFRIH